MSARIQAAIILITWSVTLALYALYKNVIKIRFLEAPIVVDLGAAPAPKPGSFLSGAGVLFVFVINIAAIGLVFGSALSPSFESTSGVLRFELPLWVNVVATIPVLTVRREHPQMRTVPARPISASEDSSLLNLSLKLYWSAAL